MKNFIVLFKPFGIDKFISERIEANDIVDAGIIFQRQNNGATIFQITLIS